MLINPSSSQDDANAIVIDSSFMYVAGLDTVPGNGQWRISKRSLSDGAVDGSFGSGGVVTSNPTSDWDIPLAIAAHSGFIYVAGHSNPYPYGWRIEKRNVLDGALDGSFGSGGVVSTDPSPAPDRARAIAVDSSFIYAAGSGGSAWRVEKRSVSDGALDGAFGSGGVVTSDPTVNFDEANAIAIDGTSMYVGGTSAGPSSNPVEWRIEKRSLSDGGLLYSVTEAFASVGCGQEGIFSIAIDSTSMYAVGAAAGGWRIEKRSLSDGALAYSQELAGSGSCDAAKSVAVDGSFMYIAGTHSNAWRIEKRNLSDGALALGNSGSVTGRVFSFANGISIDASFIYVVGAESVAGADTQWRIEKRDQCLTQQCDEAGDTLDESGGTVQTPDGTVTVDVPQGALSAPTLIQILSKQGESTFGIGSVSENLAILAELEPSGTQFGQPVVVTFKWLDSDDDSVIDGTSMLEDDLRVFRNGVPVTPACNNPLLACTFEACCSPSSNTWTLRVEEFSEYAVGVVPCVPTNTARLTIRKVTPPAGDDGLQFSGSFTVTGSVSQALDPVAAGVAMRLVDPPGVALHVRIPGGAYDRATKTGWKVSALGTRWTYFSGTGTPSGGITRVALVDKSAMTPGLVTFRFTGRNGSYGVSTAVDAEVMLPPSSQCFEATFPAVPPATPSCVLSRTTLRCK